MFRDYVCVLLEEVAKAALDSQSSWTFDAITILCVAISKAGKTDPAGIREAILATRTHAGAEGEYNFDANGDGLHGYDIVRNENGGIVFSTGKLNPSERGCLHTLWEAGPMPRWCRLIAPATYSRSSMPWMSTVRGVGTSR